VVRIACARATEADLAALTAMSTTPSSLFKARRYDDKIDVHIEFHNLLARATRNAVMVMLDGRGDGGHARLRHAAGGERNDLTIKARRRLLDALHKRDGDEAVRAMTDHLEESCAGAIATGSGRRAKAWRGWIDGRRCRGRLFNLIRTAGVPPAS